MGSLPQQVHFKQVTEHYWSLLLFRLAICRGLVVGDLASKVLRAPHRLGRESKLFGINYELGRQERVSGGLSRNETHH